MEIPPNQSILQPVSSQPIDGQGEAYRDVDSFEFERTLPPEAEEPRTFQDAAYRAPPTQFKTTFKMVLHTPDGRSGTRIGKLDTGSSVDLISQKVMETLCIKMEPYRGPDLTPIGPNIKPLGSIKLDWHVAKRKKTYTTTFVVLNASLTEGFDILLSEDTIKEVGFYKVDDSVFFLQVAEWHA